MSCSLAAVQKFETDCGIKWELASRLIGKSQDSEIILKSVCEEALEEIERYKRMCFEKSIKQRVSEKFSKEKINEFQNASIRDCCDKIFQGFSDDVLKEMLEEQIKTGHMKHYKYNDQLWINFVSSEKFLMESLYQKAVSITTESIPAIVADLVNEGVKFTEEKERK